MGRIRAVSRGAGWVLAAAVVVVCLGWGLNGQQARHAVWGRSAVGVERGKVVLARCSGALARQGARGS